MDCDFLDFGINALAFVFCAKETKGEKNRMTERERERVPDKDREAETGRERKGQLGRIGWGKCKKIFFKVVS